MTSNIAMVIDSSWLSNAISWSTLGYAFVVIGVIATLLSSHRYLLGYLLAGMGYWLVVEGIQSVIVSAITISAWHGYVAAFGITWLIPSLVLGYYFFKKPAVPATQAETYIEHTPIYNNYKPRFHN